MVFLLGGNRVIIRFLRAAVDRRVKVLRLSAPISFKSLGNVYFFKLVWTKKHSREVLNMYLSKKVAIFHNYLCIFS